MISGFTFEQAVKVADDASFTAQSLSPSPEPRVEWSLEHDRDHHHDRHDGLRQAASSLEN